MSFSVHINRLGRSGVGIGAPEIFEAATEDDAVSLALLELKRTPRAACPLMFRIYDGTHRLVLTVSPGSRLGVD